METQLLRDQNIYPEQKVLEAVLKDSYPAFEELMETITGNNYGLIPQWNFYKDGNAWLCKVVYKKKTVFWLSAWDGYFKTGFYFTEKNCKGIAALNIEKSIKEDFFNSKPIGKLLPLGMSVSRKEQIKDLLEVVAYKKILK